MKELLINKGKIVLVDDEDFDKVSSLTWYCTHNGYAINELIRNKKRTRTLMHRMLLDCPAEKIIDHINSNKLDNRKENLRICSRAENNRNLKIHSKNTTGYKGVHFFKKLNKYQAYISVNYSRINLGYFKLAKDAAMAYNKAAIELHGEFAKLNKILDEE